MQHVELRNIEKRFGSTHALRSANLELRRGEIHALLGENGAGKTSLVRVLFGMIQPDAGEILLDGMPAQIESPADALDKGIALVHQHSLLVPAFTVAENLLLGDRDAFFLSPSKRDQRAADWLERYGFYLDPKTRVETLSVAKQQRLMIVRALSRQVNLLILDEPTAVLAPSEVEELMRLLDRLRGEGMSVVFISHKMEEISSLCDRVTLLRGGETVLSQPLADLNVRDLAQALLGTDPPPPLQPPRSTPGELALRLDDLRAPGLQLSLELRRGEILGIAGIDGNGQDVLEEILAGLCVPEKGRLELAAPPVGILPGDRERSGFIAELSLAENLALSHAAEPHNSPLYRSALGMHWLLSQKLERATRAAITRHQIKGSARDLAGDLSGGNQQKLCVARALGSNPQVLVAINPTRGLDLKSTRELRNELRAHAEAGGAVLLISTDLDEVLEISTRVEVLFRGALSPLDSAEPSRERIGALMLGGTGS